jgi:hypothetical protein
MLDIGTPDACRLRCVLDIRRDLTGGRDACAVERGTIASADRAICALRLGGAVATRDVLAARGFVFSGNIGGGSDELAGRATTDIK